MICVNLIRFFVFLSYVLGHPRNKGTSGRVGLSFGANSWVLAPSEESGTIDHIDYLGRLDSKRAVLLTARAGRAF